MAARGDLKDNRLGALLADGAGGFRPELLAALPWPWDVPLPLGPGQAAEPPRYVVGPELAAAAWAALLLRQPLLLTGDPGVGKTRFAEKLSSDLGLGKPATIQVKSTMTGRELLYLFDDLARFRDAAAAHFAKPGTRKRSATAALETRPQSTDRALISYVRLQGLGRAIVRAAGADMPIRLDPAVDPVAVFGEPFREAAKVTLGDVFPAEFADDRAPRHTVVLVDELDKAPRDTPNDLLAEIEKMEFRFEELGFAVAAREAFKPIVVITSNAERNLPDAFLRRCVFHHIDTPTPEQMRKIAATRLGGIEADSALMRSAADIFRIVSQSATEKKPGTAEFIAFVAYLRTAGKGVDAVVVADAGETRAALRVVVKTNADLTATLAALKAAGRRPAAAPP